MASSSVLKQVMSAYPHPNKLKIKDLVQAGNLIDSLVDSGPDLFQVITDFDFTLTKSKLVDGQPGGSGPSVMNNSPLMSEEFRLQSKALFNKYHPMEIDHRLTIKEKIPLMVEWYERRRDLVVAAKISKPLIKQMVEHCNVVLRDGAKQALSNLNDDGVPVLIFSAGNGDILEEVMRRDGAFYPNMKVISNFLKYDDNGLVIGYLNSTLIHAFNKNEHALEHCSYFQELSHRKNAILIGDSIGDVSMFLGMPNAGAVLKIGFLNDKVEDRLESFMEAFDVVLIDDQSFDFINILLRYTLRRTV